MYLVCRLLLAPATHYTYTLSLHDALPIFGVAGHFFVMTEFFGVNTTPAGQRAQRARIPIELFGRNVSFDQLEPAVHVHALDLAAPAGKVADRKSTRLNSSHRCISYAVFCLLPRPTIPTLFPYTTLFRSSASRGISS